MVVWSLIASKCACYCCGMCSSKQCTRAQQQWYSSEEAAVFFVSSVLFFVTDLPTDLFCISYLLRSMSIQPFRHAIFHANQSTTAVPLTYMRGVTLLPITRVLERVLPGLLIPLTGSSSTSYSPGIWAPDTGYSLDYV